MNGFCGGRFEKCYTDIRVFNPSNSASNLQSTYRKHESLKKRSRLREVEHSSFTPLVLQEEWAMKPRYSIRG